MTASAIGRADRMRIDAGVNCLSYTAWTLWTLGYPDQALKRGNEALALAQALSHPHSLAFAEMSCRPCSINVGGKHAQLKRLRSV